MSSQRGIAARIERRLEATVDNAFARVFGGSVVPQEIEALLRREAETGVRSLGNRLLAPNEYIITLGMHDFEKVGADPDLTSGTFARYLVHYIREQGWQTYGEVVVRFEQSSNLHTGQYRARGAVNPDVQPRPSADDSVRPQSIHAFGAERGVAMTDNPSYRGGPGAGRPGDEYYDDRYGRPQDDARGGQEAPGGPDPRGGYPPEQGGYPPQQGYPPPRHPEQGGYPAPGGGYPEGGYAEHQGGYPGQGGYQDQRGYQEPGAYPEQRGYQEEPGGYPGQGGGYQEQRGYQEQQAPGGYPPPSYEQRPPGPAGYGGQGGQGYDQGYRPGGGYGPPAAAQPAPQGYGGYGDYGRGPARPDEAGYAPPEQRPAYPEQGGAYEQGYQQGGEYGRQEYGQGDYTQYAEPVPGGYGAPGGGYPEPPNRDYEYGQPADYGQPAGGYGGYGQGGYGSAGTTVTLQLDDGSGRTYQLREGSNIVGRGQDAQFRLPDTGVSRRHLEIRWDGQVALLTDLNSTNGTTVNNAPIQEWQLADGDVIRLGHSEIIVRIH
ncbi:FHA domain-containing protein FhaA [Mycobacterium saskatchewanense]|uniref:DUF3662 and FHA domain-containing protein n=1 Tax=Mycobacterium saskatchewanense TaxID=220927 RepID=UPI00138D4FFA|nr:DUF3662 and FHA domain-containing protein [Mycobacterium saskatchewanense]BBX64209.1 FHA domain-containing protein FhaA [Mycobacterium saskatchewanense]